MEEQQIFLAATRGETDQDARGGPTAKRVQREGPHGPGGGPGGGGPGGPGGGGGGDENDADDEPMNTDDAAGVKSFNEPDAPPCGLTLSGGGVRHALGLATARRVRFGMGLTPWSNKRFEKQRKKAEELSARLGRAGFHGNRPAVQQKLDQLLSAITTQKLTRETIAGGQRISNLISAGEQARVDAMAAMYARMLPDWPQAGAVGAAGAGAAAPSVGAAGAEEAAGGGLGNVSGPFWPQPTVDPAAATTMPAMASLAERIATLEQDFNIRSS
jgi:hypothetical protein